ncbi:MAG: PIG-L family deacetylase [Gammaproteobacteria bacterium]|nr:PIG-L family deacetylase [Gammaproteobacteria bacterium]
MSTMETDSPPHGALGCLPGNSIAVLAPHPDDEVFGCGGTLRALALRGADIHVAIVCDCPTFGKTDSSDLAAVRREESMAAAEKLGYPSPEFWGFADGKLAGDLPALQARIRAWLKKLDPDLVLAPSVWEVHNDHLAVIEATLRAMADDGSGAQLAMYEVGATLTPDTLVDITEHMGENNSP